MILKIVKAIWFFSLLACLGVLLYVYASLQESVILVEGEGGISWTRDNFFYLAAGTIGLMNMFAFVINKVYPTSATDFKTWFYGLVVTLNFFFIIGLSFISLMNSGEKFDFDRIGVVIYGSVGLIIVWALAWPGYALSKTFFNK